MKLILLGSLLAFLIVGFPILLVYAPTFQSKTFFLVAGGALGVAIYLISSVLEDKRQP